MATITTIETPTLGDRSYVVHDGRIAFVVDPQRDIDRVLAVAEASGVHITHVFETHIHNDYVTGGLALAQATGAAYHVNADDPVAFDRVPVRDGDEIAVGDRMRVRVIATPGHTFTHLSYALSDGDEAVGVFTGGSLLFGTTGRPDLLGPDHTHDLARHQYASAHRLAGELPDAGRLGHGQHAVDVALRVDHQRDLPVVGHVAAVPQARRVDRDDLDHGPAPLLRLGYP